MIPYLEQNFNSDIINGLIRLGITAKSDNDYIEKQVDLKYKKYCNRKAGKVIISDEAFKEEEAIISRIIRRAFGEVNASINDFEKIHIYDIISIHKQGTGKEISLPKGTKAKNNYGDIIIEKKSPNNLEEAFDFCLRLEETNIIPQANIKVNLKIIENMNDLKLKASTDMRNFDFDKIQGEITIRNRRDGDKFIPLGMRGSKKLKDLFIDLKIEKTERDKIPLICFGGDIAWIVGYRTSEKYKISKNTKKILQIRLESEC